MGISALAQGYSFRTSEQPKTWNLVSEKAVREIELTAGEAQKLEL